MRTESASDGEADEEGGNDVIMPPHRLPRVDLTLRGSLNKLTPCFPAGPGNGCKGAEKVTSQHQGGQWGLWRSPYPGQSSLAAPATSTHPAFPKTLTDSVCAW